MVPYQSPSKPPVQFSGSTILGTVEEEADESGFWLEMLRDISQLGLVKFEPQCFPELDRLEDEADQLVAITVASKKTARGDHD